MTYTVNLTRYKRFHQEFMHRLVTEGDIVSGQQLTANLAMMSIKKYFGLDVYIYPHEAYWNVDMDEKTYVAFLLTWS